MGVILAIETATDACSMALFQDGRCRERHEVTPRQHSQRLFAMLQELVSQPDLREKNIGAIAYGCGPGSFTGLRIAASAVQGLAFSAQVPAVAVSTLACQALTAARTAEWEEGALVLSTLDARINEAYCALYRVTGSGLVEEVERPQRVTQGQLRVASCGGPLHAVGSGCRVAGILPAGIRERFDTVDATVLPRARDLIPFALEKIRCGDTQEAVQVQPLYLGEGTPWKKLSQQGKRK